MCVDAYQWATKGSTCQYLGRDQTCDSEGENCVPTTARNFPGFPMIQDYVFGGKRFCGQKLHQIDNNGIDNHITFANVERSLICSDGKRNCGPENEPICIDNLFDCPITDI